MKAPLSWLKEYTDIELSTDQIADVFTHLGLEVESITGRYEKKEGILVAKVLESRRHPNADRLTVNKVDIGTEVLDIVCGAPNVRTGLTAPVILAGYKLPDGTEIRKSKIRGEVSCGMLCSERELGLSEAAEGLMELREGLTLGEVLSEKHFNADPVFDVAVLPNRPDCLSVIGLARELAAKLKKALRLPVVQVKVGAISVASKVKVRILAPDACPRYAARHISGVKIGPSPAWMVDRLRKAGVRSINNVVDVTNFVLLEFGHPLHAFDYHKVASGEIIVRKARSGETMKTLDGAARILNENDLLICDADKPVALAGIMGGESSEVSDSTTEILLESAYFEPVGIRKSSKRLGLTSEASYRFERGADPNGVMQALNRATALICELAGGVASNGIIDENPGNIQPVVVSIRSSRVNRLLGTSLMAEEIKAPLTALGIACTSGDDFKATVPTYRPDLTREADLIEETARVIGYANVPVQRYTSIDLTIRSNPLENFREELRTQLAGFGLMEVVTNSLVNAADLKVLGLSEEPPALLNPLSPDMGVLRNSMLVSLLTVAGSNRSRSNRDLALFEIGRVFAANGPDKQPKETEMACVLLTGLSAPVQWDGKNQEASLYRLRGLVAALVRRLSGKEPLFSQESIYACEGLKCELEEKKLGCLISVSAALLKRFNLPDPVFYFEVQLSALQAIAKTDTHYNPVSKFPPADRDLAVVTTDQISTVDMMTAIRQESPLLEEVVLFDVFRGKDLGEGRKSTAFSLRFRKSDGTLLDKEVDVAVQKILSKLKAKFNAVLR